MNLIAKIFGSSMCYSVAASTSTFGKIFAAFLYKLLIILGVALVMVM
jgi:hypothetical protein